MKKWLQAGVLALAIWLLTGALTAAETAAARQAAAAGHIICHRGAAGEEIEHTFAAYDRALSYGAVYLEQDVVLSAEGTLYVSHDSSALRLTGEDRLFRDMTDREIDSLSTENGEPIHSLQAVFDRYGRGVMYVIELKEDGSQTDAFARIVRENGLADRIIVQSFRAECLMELEAVFPEMPKMLLVSDRQSFEAACAVECADLIAAKSHMGTEEYLRQTHRLGKQFCLWTLDTPRQITAAMDLGVDFYFTNYPGLAMELELAGRPQ